MVQTAMRGRCSRWLRRHNCQTSCSGARGVDVIGCRDLPIDQGGGETEVATYEQHDSRRCQTGVFAAVDALLEHLQSRAVNRQSGDGPVHGEERLVVLVEHVELEGVLGGLPECPLMPIRINEFPVRRWQRPFPCLQLAPQVGDGAVKVLHRAQGRLGVIELLGDRGRDSGVQDQDMQPVEVVWPPVALVRGRRWVLNVAIINDGKGTLGETECLLHRI